MLADGKIVKSGTMELAMELEKTGYKGIKLRCLISKLILDEIDKIGNLTKEEKILD